MRIRRFIVALSLVFTLLFCSTVTGFASTWREQYLTQDEIRFLDSHPVLRAGVGTAFPPIMFVQEEDGKLVLKGMVADYLKLMEERLQVKIEPQFGITFKEALQRGREKSIDIFPCVASTPERSRFLAFSETYLSYPLVVITREGSPFISNIQELAPLRVAIVKPLSVYSKLKNDYPVIKFNYVFKQTVPDVLKSVSVGEADACIVNLAVAIYEINRQGLGNLRVAAPTPWKNNELSMAVRDDWSILKSIFDKAIASISIQEHKAISSVWIDVEVPEPFDYFGVLKWIGFFVILLSLVSLVATFWISTLKKEITRRKIVENELRESEASLLLAAHGNGLRLWDWDLEKDTIDFKAIDEEGRSGQEKLSEYGQKWLKDIHPKDEKNVASQLARCVNGQSDNLDLEYRKIVPDGTVVWEHMAGVVLAPESVDGPLRMVGFFRDVTASKELLKRRALSDKLESIGRLASGMAHEMNTPLHYIKGNLNYIDEMIRPFLQASSGVDSVSRMNKLCGSLQGQSDLKECLGAITESIEGVDRVTKIINALKLFAHVNESSVREYELEELIEKTLTITENEWKYCTRVSVDVADGSTVFCNPGDIIQLLSVLVVNSAQAICQRYEEKSKGLIDIQGYSEDGQLVMKVWDNGGGVDEYFRHRVFDPFFTTKEVGEGAGQGLYIAFNIVNKYNGTISSENNDSGGATFSIRLPILTEN